MIYTEELKLNIINNIPINKDDYETKVVQDVILFSWKLIDFKSDLINWIKNQSPGIKKEIETSVVTLARELLSKSHLTKSGEISLCNHLQSILNVLSSKATFIKKHLAKLK